MSFTLNDTGKLILLNVATQVGYTCIANSQGLSFMFIMIENNSLRLI